MRRLAVLSLLALITTLQPTTAHAATLHPTAEHTTPLQPTAAHTTPLQPTAAHAAAVQPAAMHASGDGKVSGGNGVSPVGASGGASTRRPAAYVVSTSPGDTLEGIDVTRSGTMYVTSVGTGAVYRGSTRSPRLQPFLPAGSDGRTSATGIHVDRWGRVLIAGASTSKLFMYDARGRLLAVREAATGSFLNDFTIVGNAVYVTDSAHNQIWRAPLTRHGLGELEPWLTRDKIQPKPYFLNGIVTDGKVLLVGEQGQDLTYRVDLHTKAVQPVEVDNGILSGDGYLLEGRHLYAVHNAGGGKYVARLARLNADATKATLIADSQPGDPGATPTTIARDRGRLLWVNSQLDVAPGTPPYTVSVVPGLR